MKRALYDLTNEEFAYFANKLCEQLNEREIKYILVGGTAVQAHVLGRLCNQNGKNLEELVLDPKIRIQDYVRATDDIDLAIESSISSKNGDFVFARKMKEIFSGIAGEYIPPSEEYILKYTVARQGIKRPIFQIHIDGETNDEQRISLNIGRNKSDLYNLDVNNYDRFINEGQKVTIPFSSKFDLNLKIIKPEHLIASKASKFRAKDTKDIYTVVESMAKSGEKIDLVEIKKLMLPKYEKNYRQFLELIKLGRDK